MMSDDDDGKMIFEDLGGLKLPEICLTSEEKPRKNLTQETCPEPGIEPRPAARQAHILCMYVCIFNPYSAKGLGDRLYATLHKMPGEFGYSFCLFLKS